MTALWDRGYDEQITEGYRAGFIRENVIGMIKELG